MLPLIDAHCHLDFIGDDLRNDQLLRARALGVRRVVVPGVEPRGWDGIMKMGAAADGVYFCLGIHPWYAHAVEDADFLRLEALLQKPGAALAGIGECGLDATRGRLALQQAVFLRQLELAVALKLPVILHAVRCHARVLDTLRSLGKRVVSGYVHGFSGSFEEARAYHMAGLRIGVGPIVTWLGATKTRDAFRRLPEEALVIETDAPDMVISGRLRGEGQPADLVDVFQALCQLRNVSPEQLAPRLWQNACETYGWRDAWSAT